MGRFIWTKSHATRSKISIHFEIDKDQLKFNSIWDRSRIRSIGDADENRSKHRGRFITNSFQRIS